MLNNCHFSQLIHQQAAQYGSKTALSYRDYDQNKWIPISWTEFSEKVSAVSRALLALGTSVQENLGIFSQNKPESLMVDFGAYGVRAVTIPFYATSSAAQVQYMVNDAEVRATIAYALENKGNAGLVDEILSKPGLMKDGLTHTEAAVILVQDGREVWDRVFALAKERITVSLATAIGGGVLRDLLLGQVPPLAFLNGVYLLASSLESLGFTVEEISRFSGIPKHMLQTGKESYDSNAQQRLNYVTDTLLPFVVQWESEDSYKLISLDLRQNGVYVHGNVEALLRADPATRADFYVKLIEHSVMCPDDARGKEELNPIPGGLGKQFLVSKNLGSLESVLKGE